MALAAADHGRLALSLQGLKDKMKIKNNLIYGSIVVIILISVMIVFNNSFDNKTSVEKDEDDGDLGAVSGKSLGNLCSGEDDWR